MGQTSSTERNLEEHIIASVRTRFQRAAGASDVMDKGCFQEMSSMFLDPKLLDIIFESLKVQKGDVFVLTEDSLIRVAEIALGGYELQAEGIYTCGTPLHDIVETVVATFFNCEKCETTPSVRGLLVEHILVNAPHKKSSVEEISHWLASVNTFPTIVRRVARKLCLGYYNKVMPELKCSTVLTPAALVTLALHLPYERRDDWTLLYASDQNGISFTQLVLRVSGAGPCLVVIESKSGRVFGGFANEGFERGPCYKGDRGCFLFEDQTILNIYHATGYDARFAYLNDHRTEVSGIGMGGGMTNWSFFVETCMEKGTSTSNISTFEKCWLAGEEIFTVKNIEIWRIGPPRQRKRYDSQGAELVGGNESVLDRDPGAIAILELSGREFVSEGARDMHWKTSPL